VAAACWPLTGRPAHGRAGDTVTRQGRYRIGHWRRVFGQRQLADSARLRLTEGVRLRLAGSVRPGLAVRSCGAGQAPGQAASHHTGGRGTDQKRAGVAPGEIPHPLEQVARLALIEPRGNPADPFCCFLRHLGGQAGLAALRRHLRQFVGDGP
jgi:hypothetical protein